MNCEKENVFIDYFVNANYKQRIHYELSSKKKRLFCISRFAHCAEDLIDKTKIFAKVKVLERHVFEQIFENQKKLYLISCKHLDGAEMNVDEAYDYVINEYSPVIMISNNQAIIKAEIEYGHPCYFVLRESK